MVSKRANFYFYQGKWCILMNISQRALKPPGKYCLESFRIFVIPQNPRFRFGLQLKHHKGIILQNSPRLVVVLVENMLFKKHQNGSFQLWFKCNLESWNQTQPVWPSFGSARDPLVFHDKSTDSIHKSSPSLGGMLSSYPSMGPSLMAILKV